VLGVNIARGIVIVALALALAPSAAASTRSGRSAPPVNNARAGIITPRPEPGFLPFTRLDMMLMAFGCCVLLLFGAGLRAVPRRRQ
jgi:hypothetical protein